MPNQGPTIAPDIKPTLSKEETAKKIHSELFAQHPDHDITVEVNTSYKDHSEHDVRITTRSDGAPGKTAATILMAYLSFAGVAIGACAIAVAYKKFTDKK
jgi:hypothetical protein